MISKNEIKYIQSLYYKKTRDKEGVFIAEGVKLVNELLQSDIVIKKIYASEEWVSTHPTSMQVSTLESFELAKISRLSTPYEVLAIAEQKKITTEPVTKKQITIALDGIQDPGNTGTFLRIADWFGVTQIVASNDTADIYNPKVVQATMGSIVRVKVWYKELAEWLSKADVPVYGALLDGESIHELKTIEECIIVVGNESKGIREDTIPYIQRAVTIPRKGGAESLNAAVAAGIILSHITN